MIGWVAQDTHLFNTTVRTNIALARPDASQAEIEAVTRAAQLGSGSIHCPTASRPKSANRVHRSPAASANASLSPGHYWPGRDPGPRRADLGLDEATAERLLSEVMSTTAARASCTSRTASTSWRPSTRSMSSRTAAWSAGAYLKRAAMRALYPVRPGKGPLRP